MNALFKLYAQAEAAGSRGDLEELQHLVFSYPALSESIRSYFYLGWRGREARTGT